MNLGEIFIILICSFALSSNSNSKEYIGKGKGFQEAKTISLKENETNFLERNIKLYLPKSKKHHSSNLTTSFLNLKDNYIIPDSLLDEYEKAFAQDKIQNIIFSEQGVFLAKYQKGYDIYADITKLKYDTYYTWNKLIKKDVEIKDYPFSPVKNYIETSPQYISLHLQICMPKVILFHISNPHNHDTLMIRSIRTDMYQVRLFPYNSNIDSKEYVPQISTILPKMLSSKEILSLQIVVLADNRRVTNGSIYIEFNDKKILIIPVSLKGEENPYRLSPIYFPSLSNEKFLSVPIKIYNPHSKVLVIREVTHSFLSINLLWPNGVPVTSNSTCISTSMLEIQPRSNKNIMYVKYYKETEGREYGVLHLRTDKEVIVIPILINSDPQTVTTYPTHFNFGLIDTKSKINKVIPLSITNMGKIPVIIKGVYTNYEDELIDFILSNNNETSLIEPSEEILYGYAVFDVSNINNIKKEEILYKIMRGMIYIETNLTKNQYIEIEFSYFIDDGKYSEIVSGNEQFIDRSVKIPSIAFDVVTKFKFPIGVEQTYAYSQSSESEKKSILIADDKFIKASIRSPNNIHKYSTQTEKTINIHVNITDLSSIIDSKYYFFPLKLTHRLHTLIPLKLFDNSLDVLFCGNDYLENQSFEQCLSVPDRDYYHNINKHSNDILAFNMNIGVMSKDLTKKLYFYIINENNHIIYIEDIETDNVAVTLDIEDNVTFNDDSIVVISDEIYKKGELKKRLKSNFHKKKEKIKVPIYANSAVKLSVNVHPLSNQSESLLKGIITLYFSNNKISKFFVTVGVYKGNLNITPLSIRFDPGFPGLHQSKSITSKSTYFSPVRILSAVSSDEKVVAELVSDEIRPNNRTEIAKIIFDPSNEFSFHSPLFIEDSSYLTYKDLFLWKDSERHWDSLIKAGKREVNAQLSIYTSLRSETVSIKAFLTKPNLIKKNEINFGLVQIGETIETYIEGFNPSDEVLRYQVILASDDYSDLNNDQIFNKKKEKIPKRNSSPQWINSNVYVFSCDFGSLHLNSSDELPEMNFVKGKIVVVEGDEEISEFFKKKREKEEILKKIYNYANDKIKSLFLSSENIICNYSKKTKKDIVLENNEELIEEIFNENFLEEIPTIKLMTENQGDFMINDDNAYSNNIFPKVIKKLIVGLKNFFQNDGAAPKNFQLQQQQDFYIPKSLSSRSFTVGPHQKFKFGPIIYHPKSFSFSSVTLFLKNNLTILYPIKLYGDGGSGIAKFLNTRSFSNKNMKLVGDSKLVIEIDKDIFFNEMSISNNITRTITLSNIGSLPLKINNISIENTGCEGYGIKILQCDLFTLRPGENVDIDLLISPDFNFYMLEKDIFFFCDYQIITLKIVVNINKDILSMKNKIFNFEYLKSYQIISLFIAILIWIAAIKIATNNGITVPNNSKVFGNVMVTSDIGKLRFEELFVKAYRRKDKSFYENLDNKQMEKQRTTVTSTIEDIDPAQINNNERRTSKKKRNESVGEINSERESKKEDSAEPRITKVQEENLAGKDCIGSSKGKKGKNKKISRKPVGMNEAKEEENLMENKNNPLSSSGSAKGFNIISNSNYWNNKNTMSGGKYYRKRKDSWKSDSNSNINSSYYYNPYNSGGDNHYHSRHQSKDSTNNQYKGNKSIFTPNPPSIIANQKTDDKSNQKGTLSSIFGNEEKNNTPVSNTINQKQTPSSTPSPSPLPNVPQTQKTPLSIHNQFNPQSYKNRLEHTHTSSSTGNLQTQSIEDDGQYIHQINSELEGASSNDPNAIDEKFKLDQMIGDSNMKATVNFSGNELTDEELMNTSNKPYFKNLITETFDNNKVFYNNPFSHSDGKGFMDELINDDENDVGVVALNTIDEVEEDIQDENEEDPEWITYEVDIKKEGYFDEKGKYKIKQIGFNFN